MKKLLLLLSLVITLILLTSCGGNDRKNPPNNDTTKNRAFIELIDYNFKSNQSPTVLEINAKTNFPENTKVKINLFGFVTSTKKEEALDTYGKTVVKNGMLNISLKPWNIPQKIEFVIDQEEQPSDVKNIFGNNGENILIDKKNQHSISPSISLFIERVNINTELITKLKTNKIPKLKFFKPKDFKDPSEKTLANFIYYFSKKDWRKMVKYTQTSQKETSKSLNNMFSSIKSIKGFEIIERINKNQNFKIIKYKLFVETGIEHRGIQQRIITANVIKENGRWGVNATSAMGGLYKN
ncbi:MAG: hypothetical protein ACPG4W_05265 [Flavobacteriales bacterium]